MGSLTTPRPLQVFPAIYGTVAPTGATTVPVAENTTWSQFLKQRPAILNAALVDLVLAGTMGDIKLCAYTRRNQMGIIHSPVAVGASSALLEASSPILKDLLQNRGNQGPQSMSIDSSEYDYEDDSDFEDEEAELIDNTLERCSPDPPNDSSLEEKGVNPSVSKFWLLVTVILYIGKVALMPFRSRSTPKPADNDDDDGDREEGSAIRLHPETVVVTHAAAKTWQALIRYIYLGEITFVPLRSRQNSSEPDRPASKIACSPKSMYRLASQLELGVLKELCTDAIKADLTPENIIQEVFSDFAWRYPEILVHEVTYLRTCARHSSVLEELKKTSKSLKMFK